MTQRFTSFPESKFQVPKPKPPYGDPPVGMVISRAEWAVYWALEKLKVDFIFQYRFEGGRQEAGGQVFDFQIPDRFLIIRVQGVYFHYETGLDNISRDDILKQAAESNGLWTVIDIDEDDALADPIYFVKEALSYVDHSRRALKSI